MFRKEFRSYISAMIGSLFFVPSLCLFIYTLFHMLQLVYNDILFVFSLMIMIVPLNILGFILIFCGLEHKNRKKFVLVEELFLFLVYLLILCLSLFGGSRTLHTSDNVTFSQYMKLNFNIIPFKTILYYVKSCRIDIISRNTAFINIFGNLFVFAPMGFYLTCLFKIRRQGLFIITLLVLLTGVETAQLLFRLGKFDIDDIILNFTGAYFIYSIIKTRRVTAILQNAYLMNQ